MKDTSVRQRCDGRPRRTRGGAPTAPPARSGCDTRSLRPPLHRTLLPPSTEISSFGRFSSQELGCRRGEFRFAIRERTDARKLMFMDRVKFGRALGYGARHAAKTLSQAVDAASAPNPSSRQVPAARPSSSPPVTRSLPDARTVRAAGRQAKSSLVTPVVRFSSVIWLQVTGVFFAMVAVTMGSAAWRARAGFHASGGSPEVKAYAYLAVCALFSYFAISSFVRARRR